MASKCDITFLWETQIMHAKKVLSNSLDRLMDFSVRVVDSVLHLPGLPDRQVTFLDSSIKLASEIMSTRKAFRLAYNSWNLLKGNLENPFYLHPMICFNSYLNTYTTSFPKSYQIHQK